MEEYTAARAQFDDIKQKGATAEVNQGDSAKANEVIVLQNKIELVQKTQEIELKHSKETA